MGAYILFLNVDRKPVLCKVSTFISSDPKICVDVFLQVPSYLHNFMLAGLICVFHTNKRDSAKEVLELDIH